MVCVKCGTEVTKNDKFCPKCGAEIVKSKRKKKEAPEVEEYKLNDKEIEKLSQSFVSRDEKYIASLGNGYIMNYLTNKSMQKGFAFVTDKRVYFKGSCLSGTGKRLVKKDEERTVDVKNITGSGFIYHRYWGILIALLVSIIVAIGSSVPFVDTLIEEVHVVQWIKEMEVYDAVLTQWNDIEFESGYWENDDERYCIKGILKDERDKYKIGIGYECNSDKVFVEITNKQNTVQETCRADDELSSITDDNYREEIIKKEALGILYEETDDYYDYIEYNVNADKHRSIVDEILPVALCLSLAVIFCIGIKNYLFKRKTLFRIEYAGGCIAFDVSFYAKAEIDDFQKQLRRAKDLAEETATIKTVSVETPVQSSVPDDLRKYADLLKEGLISQEEYEAMKKKILGL